jgi:hypothetical protein
VTIGVEDTNSGDDEEGDIESRDDDEVNKSNIIKKLSTVANAKRQDIA